MFSVSDNFFHTSNHVSCLNIFNSSMIKILREYKYLEYRVSKLTLWINKVSLNNHFSKFRWNITWCKTHSNNIASSNTRSQALNARMSHSAVCYTTVSTKKTRLVKKTSSLHTHLCVYVMKALVEVFKERRSPGCMCLCTQIKRGYGFVYGWYRHSPVDSYFCVYVCIGMLTPLNN